MFEVVIKAAVELTQEENAQLGKASDLAYAGQQIEDLGCIPDRVPYYSKFGWQPMTEAMYIEVRGEKRRFQDWVMVLPLAGQPWPQGDVNLQGGPW